MVELPFSLSRAVVISLPGSDRRPGFLSQPLGEIFEVFDAFHGATQDWTPYFDAERFGELYGRPPLPAEIGCAISHARVIREFAAEEGLDSDLLLVAEDDVRFTVDFAPVVSALTKGGLPHDLVVLADGRSGSSVPLVRRKFKALLQVSLLARTIHGLERGYRIGRFAGQGDCAGLYVVTRRGARKFDLYVRSLPGAKLDRVADAWSVFIEAAGMDIALTRPSLAAWSGGSTIRVVAPLADDSSPAPAASRRRIRVRLAVQLAVRSRLRGAGLALRATVDDARYRIRGAFRR